ncbi:MAG: HAD family hydrolase [Bacteroidales bacterium]|nr:HAD family hydrolase [Bacteroidales bacterium]MBD5287791.1 HAD family hydrolase [Bacteroides sp.]
MKLDISKVKGIIFDYGGTLDTGGDHWSVVIWGAYQKAGVAVDEAQFREAYVFAERELAKTRHILPEHDFSDLLDIKMKLELQWLSENGHFPPAQVDEKAKEVAGYCYEAAKNKVAEAKPVLETLMKKYPLVLVSNFYGNIENVLKDFGIDKCFKKIVESAVVGVRKPDPKIFELGVKALGLIPEETLVVGDSYGKDIVPAEKIGCQVLWIKGKGWTAADDAQTHDNIISDIKEVAELLG